MIIIDITKLNVALQSISRETGPFINIQNKKEMHIQLYRLVYASAPSS